MGLLAKPSAPLRTLAVDAFKVFSGQVSNKALDIIFEVLKSKSGPAGSEDLFEDEAEEDLLDSDEDSTDTSEDEIDAEMEVEVETNELETSANIDVEESLGDDDMAEYDAKLAEIFKQRALQKSAKRGIYSVL